jgi:hypothetical protein
VTAPLTPLARAEAAVARLVRAVAGAHTAAARADKVAALRPDKADFHRVFAGGAAEVARRGYTVFWNNAPTIDVPVEPSELVASAAFSQDLAAPVPGFPAGYRDVARFLCPDVVWVACSVLVPGRKRRMHLDGFVALGAEWRWFPRPWRVLPAKTSTSSHWAD